MKIIITDVENRKSFDIYHIYKSKGYDILSFSSQGYLSRLFLSFIYKTKVKRLRKDKNFLNDFKDVLSNKEEYIFFPVEEDTILRFIDIVNDLNYYHIDFLLPSKDTFQILRNKSLFSDFCQKNSIPIPQEYKYSYLLELYKNNKLPLPLIAKPKVGSGAVGIIYIDKNEDLQKLQSVDIDKYIIQKRLKNASTIEGGFFLMKEGEVISYYGHKRIRTYPPSGGISVFSKCEINQKIKNLGSSLLAKLNYTGLAMVECLYDEEEKNYKVIEVNPRSWGSIMLSEFCGSQMLENYVRICQNKKIMQSTIDEDRYIRWIFPWDILLLIKLRANIKDFLKIDKKCCYINFTYAPKISAFLFLFYNFIKIDKIVKFFRKIVS